MGIWCQNDFVSTSMRFDINTTSFLRHLPAGIVLFYLGYFKFTRYRLFKVVYAGLKAKVALAKERKYGPLLVDL